MPTPENILSERHMTVAKHNELVREKRYDLSLREQKVLLYLISKIKPDDLITTEYTISVHALCDVCGIARNRANIIDLREILLNLRNCGFYLPKSDGGETTVGWLARCTFDAPHTTATVKFDDYLLPYLMQLRDNYTSYELEFVLAMQSRHAIRLFELVKSYAYQGFFDISIDELKEILCVTGYPVFSNFRIRVLDVAVEEINRYTDLFVSYEAVRSGKKFASIRFFIDQKGEAAKLAAFANRHEVLSND